MSLQINVIADKEDLVKIADSIRLKTGKTELMSLNDIAQNIDDIISSPDGSEVTFGSSDGTNYGTYSISAEVLDAIAGEIQKMAGRTIAMTPEEILYWLRRVVYIPQGYAESINIITNGSTASGILPTVVKGFANSIQTIYSTSTAIGSIVEST